jgi:hypothetical protein
MPVGQVREQDVAGGAFDEGGDRRAAVRANDQIAFPVARDGTVLDFGGPIANHQHRRLEPRTALVRTALRSADCPACAQTPGQLAPQFAAALDVEGLVDRLVRHVHLRAIGKPQTQPLADLLRAPFSAKTTRDLPPQQLVPR